MVLTAPLSTAGPLTAAKQSRRRQGSCKTLQPRSAETCGPRGPANPSGSAFTLRYGGTLRPHWSFRSALAERSAPDRRSLLY